MPQNPKLYSRENIKKFQLQEIYINCYYKSDDTSYKLTSSDIVTTKSKQP
jgi:hypothetical protein